MAFLNPLLLFGIGAISVPIIIHLLTNRKIKKVVWAAMRFLQESVEEKQRRMNLEDLILLALRCLLLILLALALARPTFRKSGIAGVGDGQEMAVISIDNSYSMSQTDGVTSRFEDAKKAAEQVLDALPHGSSVSVSLFSDVVRAEIPEPTYDLNLARKVIRDAELSDHTTDVQPALEQAFATLKSHAAPRKGVYLITDGQANGWRQPGQIRKALEAAKTDVTTRLILVGSPEDHNLGVSDLQLASAFAPVNAPLRFEIEVTNYGTSEAKNVQVGLSTDDEPAGDQAVIDSILPGASSRVSLFVTLRDAGYHAVTARIPHDHVPADDQRTIAIRALKEITVLLVDGDPGIEPRDSEVFYLRNALTPVDPDELNNYFIKTKTISPAELESSKLGDYEAVVLADVQEFSDTTLAAFEKYLGHGGGLIFFPGSKINVGFYNDQLQKKYGFLPARLGAIRGDAEQQGPALHWQDKNYDHSIVSIWNDPAAGTLATANFYRSFELTPDGGGNKESGPPAVVLHYADGKAAVVEHTWGFGRVILFSSTASTKWNDLPVRPSFVPLILRSVGSILNRQDEQLNLAAGAKFRLICDPDLTGKDANIVKPEGKKDTGGPRRITVVNGVPMLQFDDTDIAGGYTATIDADPPAVIKFAVLPNPEESKMEELTKAQLAAFSPPAQVVRWTPGTNLGQAIEKERSGTEFWTVLALLALITAVAESILADQFSKSK